MHKKITLTAITAAQFVGGCGTTAAAVAASGRRWIMTELMAEYVAGKALRFARAAGFECAIPSLKLGT